MCWYTCIIRKYTSCWIFCTKRFTNRVKGILVCVDKTYCFFFKVCYLRLHIITNKELVIAQFYFLFGNTILEFIICPGKIFCHLYILVDMMVFSVLRTDGWWLVSQKRWLGNCLFRLSRFLLLYFLAISGNFGHFDRKII